MVKVVMTGFYPPPMPSRLFDVVSDELRPSVSDSPLVASVCCCMVRFGEEFQVRRSVVESVCVLVVDVIPAEHLVRVCTIGDGC